MVPLVYHDSYNIRAFGLERRHPFDAQKYGRIRQALIERGLRRAGDFVRPRACSRRELLAIHPAEYLDSLMRSATLARIFEVPEAARVPGWLLDWLVLRPMRRATGGTLLACRLALAHGLAINLGGGYHHASAGEGSGFSVYADIPLAALRLHQEGRLKRVLVVDLDAHQGNGVASLFRNWPWAAILDLYGQDLFPRVKEEEDEGIAVESWMAGEEYLAIVEDRLPPALERYQPDLVIYNAGSDPYKDDPLARFELTRADIATRDLLVARLVRERGCALAMVLSGGYAQESWQVHTDAIERLLTRFDPETDWVPGRWR